MTAAYSINLRIMGKSNISLLGKATLFNNQFLQSLPQYFDSVLIVIVVIIIVTVILIFGLDTELG